MENTQESSLQEIDSSCPQRSISAFVGRILGSATAIVWRWGNDRRAVAAFVGRYSAHLSILVLALLIGMAGRIALTPISVAVTPEASVMSLPVAAEPVATPTTSVTGTLPIWQGTNQVARAVFRMAQPRTDIPERVRLEVITYTVQSGDNIFLIAERFKLSAYSIAWSNMETLQGSPWLIQPGLTLFIPPVDGAYHTVMAGETLDSLAEQYEVSAVVLDNVWNELEPGVALYEGQQLMIPGGVGEDVEWEAPPPDPVMPGVYAASGSWGACGDVAVSGPGATGWFVLPTGSYAVSGWYFGDPRNPGHIGLDYRCRLGDPIYAADNGVVVFAGWSGGYGNLVRVRHGNGYETYYAHFSSFAVGCGEAVYQGQVVGYCGSTGWSTGPHLHYEIRLNGVPQNPQLFEP
ncbi:MAG: peptidoglycan DD-metalloendopeptidase family protein [Anaerolineae bacterium]